MERYYFGFNIVVVAVIAVCWANILRVEVEQEADFEAEDPREQAIAALQNWAKVAQTALAVPEIALAVAAVSYGSMLVYRIRQSLSAFGKQEDEQRRPAITI